jgi:hypothetical protein
MEQISELLKNIKRNKYTTAVGLVVLAQTMYSFHFAKIGVVEYLTGIAAALALLFYAPSIQRENEKQNQ